jgi:hypothetical protein
MRRVGFTSVCPPSAVPLGEAARLWAKVALLSFGGPAGQIAVMHRFLVEEKKWISEERFLHALNYCMLLPGPEAQQLAVYTGWLLNGTAGGLIAGTLFVLPGLASAAPLRRSWPPYSFVAIFRNWAPWWSGTSASPFNSPRGRFPYRPLGALPQPETQDETHRAECPLPGIRIIRFLQDDK